MTKYPLSLINAFTNPKIDFLGNPCAVVLLSSAISDDQMQQIAADLSQPATSFLIPQGNAQYDVRWFAPDEEILLCGHGSLAATAFLFNRDSSLRSITLKTKTAKLIEGTPYQDYYQIKLDRIEHKKSNAPKNLEAALGEEIAAYYETDNKHIVVLKNEQALKRMKPDFEALRKIDVFGYSVTAKSDEEEVDFVSRTLVPHVKQLEDHATGSSHALLLPFWQKELGKNEFVAKQHSPRGGFFKAKIDSNYVYLRGNTTLRFNGELIVE